ncbi:MAG: HAMP domain-containing sensor histidine kinase, partial [Humidesulfovibrio sp.]|nr:HAMP domain-containing sensor histidine kinase [Humidesulfovibrio sp.]
EINNPLGIVHQAVQNLILRTSPERKKNLETAAGLGLDMDKLQAYLKARKLDLFLQDIQAAALRASGIIRNMLNFSRRSESTRQTCDLQRIIEQSVFLASSDYDLKKAFDFKHIEIVQDLEAGLPACRCTETELEQVLLNLLRNAAQAMAMADPPTQAPRIELRLRAGKDCVRIEVADNGPGMDPETQRKALEPFFTTKPPGVGTGLGLSVSYFIITKGHGGKMWLTSAPGRGTTFFIELPADEQEASDV